MEFDAWPTSEVLKACPPWEDACEEVRTMLDEAWICAHNGNVEYKVLTRHLPSWEPVGVLDSLCLARAT